MRRREFFALLGSAAAAWPTTAKTQQASRAALIGRLSPGFADDTAIGYGLRAFQDGLRALGHIEGQTYRLESRYAEGDLSRLPALAAQLVAMKVDVIVAVADDAVRAAIRATANIPIVMAMSGIDPVRAGYITSLARPGGNVTGFTGQLEELNTKQLELLRELVPGLMSVTILYNPRSPQMTSERLDRISEAGAAAGLKVRQAAVAHPKDLEAVFETLVVANGGGLIVLPEQSVMDPSRVGIAKMALRHRIPTVSSFRMYVDDGGLLSYAQDLVDMHRRSATYVDKILKGARPAELPVEQPTKFELVINLKTAKALGITVPPSLLARADELIE